MKRWLTFLLLATCAWAAPGPEAPLPGRQVYIIPVRDDIMPPLVYLIRRGVKEAMNARAEMLVLDMETNGGRVDVTEEIIQILGQFKGRTATYVNRKAFSAGAFISVATQKIYMAPQSVIGAAAPILMIPGGGAEKTPDTIEVKMTSGISALVRAAAEKNGHNKEVVEAMIDKNKELRIDGQVLNAKGQILTLTNVEAEQEYGDPPKPLLSAGTFESLDSLLDYLGFAEEDRVRIEPLGAEKLASWINLISPLLLIIGVVGLYIEFKTPGFGLPGIAGLTAFAIYFLGGYVAGLAGLEWAALFLLGVILVIVELFLLPGTALFGIVGAFLMVVGLVMAMVDLYPGMPRVPTLPQLRMPLVELALAMAGSGIIAWMLSWILPKTSLYSTLVSQSASGVTSVNLQSQVQLSRMGQTGITTSVLRPGGKAQFGDEIIDVITQGDMLPRGQRVRVIGSSGSDAIVEAIREEPRMGTP